MYKIGLDYRIRGDEGIEGDRGAGDRDLREALGIGIDSVRLGTLKILP